MSAETVVNNIINMTLLSRRLKSSFYPGPHDHGTCSGWGQAHFHHLTLCSAIYAFAAKFPRLCQMTRKNAQCSSSQSQLWWGEIVQVHCGNSNSKKKNKTETHLIAATEIAKDFSHLSVGNSPPQQGRARLTLFIENKNLKELRTKFSCKGKYIVRGELE